MKIYRSPRRLINLLRAALASVNPAEGAAMVGYKLNVADSLARTVFGKLAEEVSVLDFIPENMHGAIKDGSNVVDLKAYIQFALSRGYRVYFPQGTYISSGQVLLRRDQYLEGDGREKSILRFTGATKGLVLDLNGQPKIDGTLTFDSMMVRGNSAATELVYIDNVGSVAFKNCIVRNSSTRPIYLGGEVINFHFDNGYIEAFAGHGIECAGSLTGLALLKNVKFNGFSSDGTTPAAESACIGLTGASIAQLKLIQVNVNGGGNVNAGNAGIGSLFRANGGTVTQISTDQCYTEFITRPSIYATGAALFNMASFEQSNFHTGNTVSIDLNNGQAHTYVRVSQCRRPGTTGYIFDPGATTDWAFLQGSRESGGTQYVVGHAGVNNIFSYGAAGLRNIGPLRVTGALTALGGLTLDNTCTVTETSGNITINAAQAGKTIANRIGGTDRAVTEEACFRPGTDNQRTLGTGAMRWSTVYAATGTINTSDARAKQDIAELDAAERRVALALRGLVKRFRYCDAVADKGDAARIHVGVIAQEAVAAFQAEGLDAMRYGIVCYDQWDAVPAVENEEGEIVAPAVEAGDRYGIRYEELLAFLLASG